MSCVVHHHPIEMPQCHLPYDSLLSQLYLDLTPLLEEDGDETSTTLMSEEYTSTSAVGGIYHYSSSTTAIRRGRRHSPGPRGKRAHHIKVLHNAHKPEKMSGVVFLNSINGVPQEMNVNLNIFQTSSEIFVAIQTPVHPQELIACFSIRHCNVMKLSLTSFGLLDEACDTCFIFTTAATEASTWLHALSPSTYINYSTSIKAPARCSSPSKFPTLHLPILRETEDE
ncbi:unnamed protein product [Cyprideis torosa]|uniref:Uncharacterized protein n=1 Tax=Cyprideis torosa TaxID=163714 RepID=A0A7R8ZS63_9CRUS|nr:unnamed protein product [Cyprideis torosa]CAG0895484.1 unnamed protein product [Cyprideis torosa]